jgi:lipopolysaccharide/colanic/teichoic acid biosynthesis glycosyltransferase
MLIAHFTGLVRGRKSTALRSLNTGASVDGSVSVSRSLQRPGIGVRVGQAPQWIAVGPLSDENESAPSWGWKDVVRRSLNVLAAALLLILAAPLMILIALAIKLSSRGPVLFTQPRVGVDRRRDDPNAPVDPRRRVDHGGRIFQIYKFRTMKPRPEGDNAQMWASHESDRITKLGRFLRRYRLDELPQLFNILKGDMNLVGPRPEQPDIFKDLRDQIDGYQRRQRVLPGITGLAQVNHHYDQSVDDVRTKVSLDLTYLEQESPLQDLRIMAQTVPVVLFGKGSV